VEVHRRSSAAVAREGARAMSAFIRVGTVPAGEAFRTRDGGMYVITSVDEINGAQWFHISVSRKSRTPSYEDLAMVKAEFVRDDVPAYQVFPKKMEHRNFHPNCLHLWVPLGDDPFPDPLGERAGTIGPSPEEEAECRAWVEQQQRARR
jgi:hypothetical protein